MASSFHDGKIDEGIAKEYIQALSSRFRGSLYDDPVGDLKSLKQTKSVLEYQEAFEELMNRVELLETYVVSCFLRR